jgi:hypothetical protein
MRLGKGIDFTRDELALLHETVAYAHKRTFSEGDKVRLKDILGRIEERLLDQRDPARPFAVTAPEAEAFAFASETYCEALEAPFAAEVSRRKAARVKDLVGRFRHDSGFISALRRLFGRA